MTVSDIIQIISIISTSILSVVAIIVSVLTLRKSNKTLFESSRANIQFFFDTPTGFNQYLVLKNFGNSSGSIINIDISPKLSYSKCPKFNTKDYPKIVDYTDMVLAPGQSVKSWFPLRDYPDKLFNVTVTYKTLKKIYTESYKLDVSYVDHIDYIYTHSKDTENEKDALVNINNNIMRLIEKF